MEIMTMTDDPQVDLDAYCARIGYTGARTPTIETLRALHELHPAAFTFEAIDVLLDRGIDLAPAAVDSKMIARGRGGYCYEQNGLFKRVLTAMGFEVEGLIARVHWMNPPDAPTPLRTHMALRVTLAGKPWLADVGFGSCVPTSPLRFDTAEPQPTRHESFRLIPAGEGFRLDALLGEKWEAVYELSNQPQLDDDYQLANWFIATHPTSFFRQQLVVTRTTPEARLVLDRNRLTVRKPDGTIERRVLTADGIERVLAESFGLSVEPAWRPIIERAAAET
jgi:N-hydroxyarylamine O-acetyltransferase